MNDHLDEHEDPVALGPRLAAGEQSIGELLTRRTAAGTVLQDLTSISESLPWLRSQHYWAQAGVEVFTSGEVPYVATNDGEQSRKALELYWTSLRAAERAGRREPISYVLELGAGSGLFAKLFLDQLKARSQAEGTQDYERTIYLVCDNSPGLLRDTRESGVLADHEPRIVRVQLPTREMRASLLLAVPEIAGGIRAVHANYMLDSLPFSILSISEAGTFELRIRTLLRDGPAMKYAPPSFEDIPSVCAWLDEVNAAQPQAPHHALAYEAEYVRITRETVPFPELIPSHDPANGSQQLVHSFGALACLQEVVGLLSGDGYFVALDYGYDRASAEPIEFQCFGTSIAAGVNFQQLMQCARMLPGTSAEAPETDPASLQARMFTRQEIASEVVEQFRKLYDRKAWEEIDAPFLEALKLAQGAQCEAARWKFADAHAAQPYNWNIMESMVAFMTYTLSEHEAALEIAKRALQLNHISPRLWNLLGDCYYGMNALESAERAYLQALRVNPSDVRARANLAYVFLKRGRPPDALRIIGEALAIDHAGECRDELIAKQGEAIQSLAEAHARSAYENINRLTGHHRLPGRARY